jgi:hypothetical protein
MYLARQEQISKRETYRDEAEYEQYLTFVSMYIHIRCSVVNMGSGITSMCSALLLVHMRVIIVYT